MASSAIVPSGGSTVWAADTTMNMGGRSLTDEDLASLIVKNGGSNLQRVFVGLTRGDGTTITADQMITRMEAATQLIDNVIGVEEKKGKLKRVLQENSTAFINAVRSFRDQPEDVLLTLRPGQEELVDLILKMREAQVTVPEPKSFAPLAAAPLTSPPAAAPPVSPALKRSSAEGVPPVAAPQTASPAAEKPEEPASKAQKGSDGTDAELRRHLDRSLRAFQEHSSQPSISGGKFIEVFRAEPEEKNIYMLDVTKSHLPGGKFGFGATAEGAATAAYVGHSSYAGKNLIVTGYLVKEDHFAGLEVFVKNTVLDSGGPSELLTPDLAPLTGGGGAVATAIVMTKSSINNTAVVDESTLLAKVDALACITGVKLFGGNRSQVKLLGELAATGIPAHTVNQGLVSPPNKATVGLIVAGLKGSGKLIQDANYRKTLDRKHPGGTWAKPSLWQQAGNLWRGVTGKFTSW